MNFDNTDNNDISLLKKSAGLFLESGTLCAVILNYLRITIFLV